MRLTSSLLTGIVAGAVACSGATTRRPAGDSGGRIITAEQIAAWNVADGIGVLERVGGYTIVESRTGEVIVRRRRGRTSLNTPGADRAVVVLDNVLLSDPRLLRDVRAGQIDRVEVLSGGQATNRYGTGAGAGAILIFTRGGR